MIKNIIFDLGVVIIDIIDEKEWFQDYIIPLIGQNGLNRAIENDLFTLIETGKISTNAFYRELNSYANRNFSIVELRKVWNTRLLTIPRHRMDLLISLATQYKLFLLSNTNDIHINRILEQIEEQFGRNLFNEVFDKQFYSNELGIKKPDRPIYEYVIKDLGIQPEETVFIDDTLDNLKEPRLLGIRTIHFQNDEQFKMELSAMLIN